MKFWTSELKEGLAMSLFWLVWAVAGIAATIFLFLPTGNTVQLEALAGFLCGALCTIAVPVDILSWIDFAKESKARKKRIRELELAIGVQRSNGVI